MAVRNLQLFRSTTLLVLCNENLFVCIYILWYGIIVLETLKAESWLNFALSLVPRLYFNIEAE